MEAWLIRFFENKEFGALVLICVFQMKQFYQNKGAFAVHLEKIHNVNCKAEVAITKSEKAMEASSAAVVTANKAYDMFEPISEKWREFMDEKHGKKDIPNRA